jgi:hypothetical protein
MGVWGGRRQNGLEAASRNKDTYSLGMSVKGEQENARSSKKQEIGF